MLNSKVVKDPMFLCAFDCTTYTGNAGVEIPLFHIVFEFSVQEMPVSPCTCSQHDYKNTTQIAVFYFLLAVKHNCAGIRLIL